MKVLCVNGGEVNPHCKIVGPSVVEGGVYTISGEDAGFSSFYGFHLEAYWLEEVDGLYDKRLFVLLSDIDEIEIAEERQLLKEYESIKITELETT